MSKVETGSDTLVQAAPQLGLSDESALVALRQAFVPLFGNVGMRSNAFEETQ